MKDWPGQGVVGGEHCGPAVLRLRSMASFPGRRYPGEEIAQLPFLSHEGSAAAHTPPGRYAAMLSDMQEQTDQSDAGRENRQDVDHGKDVRLNNLPCFPYTRSNQPAGLKILWRARTAQRSLAQQRRE
ncbi:MAG: hypothetical protein AAB433_05420 [Nitrospirota bacterium]